MSERCMWTSKEANGPVSGPVRTSRFLVILDHSGLLSEFRAANEEVVQEGSSRRRLLYRLHSPGLDFIIVVVVFVVGIIIIVSIIFIIIIRTIRIIIIIINIIISVAVSVISSFFSYKNDLCRWRCNQEGRPLWLLCKKKNSGKHHDRFCSIVQMV